jgi:hypothetical protein
MLSVLPWHQGTPRTAVTARMKFLLAEQVLCECLQLFIYKGDITLAYEISPMYRESQLALGAAASAVFSYVIVPGLKFVGEKLVEAAVDHTTSDAVKAVVSWLRRKQEEKKILDFVISLPDGTRIQVDPPDRAASSITISFANGRIESMTYS